MHIVFRCVNSSLNFFVYYRMGSRFRRTLWTLLPCKRVKVSTYTGQSSDSAAKESDQTQAQVEKPRVCIKLQRAIPSTQHSVTTESSRVDITP